MNRLIVALTLLGTATASQAQQAQMFTPSVDGKEISCATALQPEGKFDQSLRWWALGYWSGQNAANHALTGLNTDPNGIIGEIEKLCRDQPSMLFISAVGKVYVDMKKQRR